MRTDLYTLIHKAQRFHLYRAAAAIGLCNAEAFAGVAGSVRELIAHLHDHARNEETYIHPLFARIPGGDAALARLEGEHAALKEELAAVERCMNDRERDGSYAIFNRFLGGYLLHMALEERTQADLLWPHIPEEEYAAVMRRFQAERGPERSRADLAFMVPALNAEELLRVFRGIKAAAPAPAFAGACAIAAGVLPAERWQRVVAAL